MNTQLTVVLPKTVVDELCKGLRVINRALDLKHPEGARWGVMGWGYGYGHEHVGAIFEMHPHTEEPPDCTCGRDERWLEESGARVTQEEYRAWQHANPHLPRCADKPNFRHFRTGVEVRWHKWIGRSVEVWGDPSAELWAAIVAECLAEVAS